MPKPSPTRSARPQRRPSPVEPPARTDWLVVLLAAAGVIVSGYLGWLKVRGGNALLCEAGGGCDIVQASRYATILWRAHRAVGHRLLRRGGGAGRAGLHGAALALDVSARRGRARPSRST